MEKAFHRFIDLIYINGYFEAGSCNGEEYAAKPFFVLNLLKGSVHNPDEIYFTRSAINGYIDGNSIDSVIKKLIEAGYNNECLEAYIAGLYQTKHKDTPTYRNRFKGKIYKEALYEKVKKEFQEVKPEKYVKIFDRNVL